jgi:hypothetical protein
MKIRVVGAEFFHADRRTDVEKDRRDEATRKIRFPQFCESVNKCVDAS